jgi:hypothetical protein
LASFLQQGGKKIGLDVQSRHQSALYFAISNFYQFLSGQLVADYDAENYLSLFYSENFTRAKLHPL